MSGAASKVISTGGLAGRRYGRRWQEHSFIAEKVSK